MPTNRNPGQRGSGQGGNLVGDLLGDLQPQHTPTGPAPQAQPAQQPRELARAPHSDSVAIVVTQSKDGARLFVETWTRHSNGWRLGAFTPSFAAVLIDSVVDALHQARDRRAGGA